MMGECLVARCAARLANAVGSCPIRNLGDGKGGRGEQEGWMEEEDSGVGTLFGMEGRTAKGRGLINSLLCFSHSHFCPPHPHIPAGPSRHGKSLFFSAPRNLVTFFLHKFLNGLIPFIPSPQIRRKANPQESGTFFPPYFVT